MKRILYLAVAVAFAVSLCSCGAVSKSERAARKAEQAAEEARIAKAIVDRNFNLEITQIMPVGYPSRSSQAEYYMYVRKDVVDTRLPFIGDSHYAAFGGTEISIVFDKEKVQFIEDFSDSKKGEYRYTFKGCYQNGSWTVILQLYSNGRAHIGCSSPNRGDMTYFADIIIPEENEK